MVLIVAPQPQRGRLVGDPALVERGELALAPHEREAFVRFAQRQQHAHQGLVERCVLRLRIARGARLGRGLGEAALLVQHDRERRSDLGDESFRFQHVTQDALRRRRVAGLAQHLAVGHAQPHVARPCLHATQELPGEVAVAPHVAQFGQRDLRVEVRRVGTERSEVGLFRLVEAGQIGECAATVECNLTSAEASAGRAVELGEGFLGTLLLAQQRAEIVPRGRISGCDLERLAIGGLGIGVPSLAAQCDAQGAPRLGIPGVGGQQLLRLAGRSGMQ